MSAYIFDYQGTRSCNSRSFESLYLDSHFLKLTSLGMYWPLLVPEQCSILGLPMGKPLNNENFASFRLPLVEPMKKNALLLIFFSWNLCTRSRNQTYGYNIYQQSYYFDRPLGKLGQQVFFFQFWWQSVCGS